ncbi:uncharacterized protein FYW61_006100 [Anableps anableps]
MGLLDRESFGTEVLFRLKRPKEELPLSEEQLKVETMESDVELLLETLAEFSQNDLETFKMSLQSGILLIKSHSIQHSVLQEADLQDTVLVMVDICGLQSVNITKNILMEMRKNSLVKNLSGTRSKFSEENLDKHLAELIHKVASMVAAKDLLSEILMTLTPKQFKILKWFLQSAFFHMGLPQLSWSQLVLADKVEIVNQLVSLCGRQSVEVAAEVLTDMNMHNLALRLSEGYRRQKEKQKEPSPELDKTVDQLETVIEHLLNGLAGLSSKELETFKYDILDHTSYNKYYFTFHSVLMKNTDLLELAFLLVQTYGQEYVKKVTRFSEQFALHWKPAMSGSEKEVDEQQSALIHKVATLSAFKQLLVRTLTQLSSEELEKLKMLLLQKFEWSHSLVLLGPKLMHEDDRAEIVGVMMEQLGQRSVEVTRDILKDLKRADLLPGLPEYKEEILFGEKQAAGSVKKEEDFRKILLKKLNDLGPHDLDKFKWLLQFTYFRRSIPQIRIDQLEKADSAYRLVQLMVESLGQKSLEVAREVFIDMNRSDLLKRLPETRLESKDFSSLLQSEAKMKPDVRKLLEVLKYLSDMELEHFKNILQKKVWSSGFKLILKHQEDMVERLKVAEVMVQLLEKQSLGVAMQILEEIKRTDLHKKLFYSSSASEKRPSKDPEGGGLVEKHSSRWRRVEPEITDVDGASTYSFQSAAGQFECCVSGLRWVCKDKLCFKYQFCSWEGHMKRMESRGYRPAGPLIDITVITGRIQEVYLPHWICIDDIPSLLQNFSVLHINDSGDILEKVSEVTATHVRLTEPVFSPLAALINSIFRVKVTCNLLIYYQPHTPFLKLHVYLIPHDPALQESVRKEESSSGYEAIKKPRPDGYLRMHQGFTLRAAIDSARIQPPKLTLRYDSQDPNFYEVFIQKPDRNFDLALLLADSKKGEKRLDPVWTCEIRRDDHPKSGLVEAAGPSGGAAGPSLPDEEHFVDKHRDALIQRARNIGPILDGLLQKKVLQQETYDTIRSLPTSEARMREIFSCLTAAGVCKDIFLSILQEKEQYLIADLQRQE